MSTLQVTMRESVFAAGGVAMLAGTVQTLQADEAAGLVQQNKATRYGTGWAEDPDSLTPAQIAAVGALVSGDGLSPNLVTRAIFAGLSAPIAAHYKLATFGDSRVNNTTHGTVTTSTTTNVEKTGSALCRVRPDMKLVFNGGVSGGVAANWDNDSDIPTGRVTTGKSMAAMLSTTPDLCLVQLGINGVLGWNGSSPTQSAMAAAIISNLQACCAAIMNAGVYLVFESVNPCAPASISYINGYIAAGGYGSNAALKAQIVADINTAMQAWLASYPYRATYVDTSAATTGTDGYAKTDGTYYDGTHMSMFGSWAAAKLIDAAIKTAIPWKAVCTLPTRSRSAVNGMLSGVSGGAASGWGTTADSGTWSADQFSVVGDQQIITMTCTALASGYARRLITIAPSFIGASTLPAVAAGDVLQARVEYEIDDGNDGNPIAYALTLRPRLYYNDASNEYVVDGQPNVTTSTDHPAMLSGTGYLMTPGLALKAGMANANITAFSQLQLMVIANRTGTVRVKLRNAEWRKVG